MTTKLPFLGLVAAAVLLGGCAKEPQPRLDVRLERATSCEDLESRLKQDALLKMNAYVDHQIARHLRYMEDDDDNDVFAPESGGEGNVSSSASGGSVNDDGGGPPPPDHSDTNNQVEGVNEADIVKTDGNYLYVLHGQQLSVMASWPASELGTLSEVTIEGQPHEMFLRDDQLVVYSRVEADGVFDSAGEATPEPTDDYEYWYAPTMTKMTVLSVNDKVAPKVQKELYFEGNYLSSRRVDASVRTVLRDGYHLPKMYYYPSSLLHGDYPKDHSGWIALYELMRAENIKRVQLSTLEDYVPARFATQADGSLARVATSCTDYYVPTNGTTAYGLTQIQSVDLDALGEAPRETQIVGDATQVYANADAMFLAGTSWSNPFYSRELWDVPVSNRHTHVHKFDISGAEAAYRGSGTVPGYVLNQFSMDERNGFLRIATNDTLVSKTEWTTVNHLHVLEEKDGALQIAGRVGNLAPGERIFSARFVGERGYMVTFRQVDPLFVIDLSNPRDPQVKAALKIPGFSEYMHPIDDNTLLTIGRDGTDEGAVLGVALQMFDVSDATNPKLVHKELLNDGHSEAEYNHKAFTFYNGQLAIPMQRYDYEAGWGHHVISQLLLFDVDSATGITPMGSVDHSAFFGDVSNPYCYPYSLGVRRGVFIEDYVYSISEGGVMVSATDELQTPVASVAFAQPTADPNCY